MSNYGESPPPEAVQDPYYDDAIPEVNWQDPEFVEAIREQVGSDELALGLVLAREKAEAEMQSVFQDPNTSAEQRQEARRKYNAVVDARATQAQQPRFE